MKASMKKICLPVIAMILCMSMVLTGCGGTKEKPEEKVKKNEYEKLAGIYHSDLSVEGGMSVELYLQINKKGEFVFARDTDFSSKEKGAGHLEKSKEGKDTFVYEIVRDEEVKAGENVSEFEVTEEGGIQFTSLMWFGSTTPRFTSEDGTETYPLFLPYEESEEEQEAEEEIPEISEEEQQEEENVQSPSGQESSRPDKKSESKPESKPQNKPAPKPEPAPQPAPQPEPQKPASNFREGTYTGTYNRYVDAMQSDIHYDMTLSLSGGSYTYNVRITVSGQMEHSETQSYSGSYTVDGNHLNMTGKLKSGDAGAGGDLRITGILSSFASGNETVTLYR